MPATALMSIPADGRQSRTALNVARGTTRLAVWAFAGAVAGGCIAYLIGAHAFDTVGRPLLTALDVGDARVAASEAAFGRHGLLLVFVSTVSPLSTKLTCVAAGAFGLPFAQFFLALLIGRAIRFAVLTLLLRYAGERLVKRLALPPSGRLD